MSSTKHFATLAAVVALCAGGLWLARTSAQEHADNLRTIAALEKSRAGLESRLKAAEARRTAADEARDAALAALESAKAAEKKAATSAAARAQQPKEAARNSGSGSANDWRAVVINNPKLESLFLESTRDRIRSDYGLLFTRCSLSPEQIERFVGATARMQEAELDIFAVSQADPEKRDSLRKLAQGAQEEYNVVLRELFGADGQKVVRDFNRLGAARTVVNELGGVAALAGTPLTVAQAQQLCDVVASATPAYASGGYADVRSVNWPDVDARAAQILTPAQFEVYRRGLRGTAQIQEAIAAALKAEGRTLQPSTR